MAPSSKLGFEASWCNRGTPLGVQSYIPIKYKNFRVHNQRFQPACPHSCKSMKFPKINIVDRFCYGRYGGVVARGHVGGGRKGGGVMEYGGDIRHI